MSGKSIFDKLWDRHVITGDEGQPQLMYVDQHYIHEVTSPQAFQGLRDAGRKVRRPDLTFGTFDHNVPTVNTLILEMLFLRHKLINLLKMSLSLVLTMRHMVRISKELYIWLVQKQDVRNQVSLLFVGIVTQLPTVPLEL